MKKSSLIDIGKFYIADIKAIDKDSVVIKLPIKAAKYLGWTERNPKIFWIPINGVIQLSNEEPNLTIPTMSFSQETEFEAHDMPEF